MEAQAFRIGRFGGAGRWFGVQVGASVLAAVCVSLLFAANRSDAPPIAPSVSDTGKSLRRVADGTIETRVLQLDPQLQAARDSFASFAPMPAPAISPTLMARGAPRAVASVLPPRRPVDAVQPTVASVATQPAVDTAAGNWQVAGVEIPGSARVRRYVPTGADLLKPADFAWAASKSAVKKVASLGALFGL